MLEKSRKILKGNLAPGGFAGILLILSAMSVTAQGTGRGIIDHATAEALIKDTHVLVKVVAVRDNAILPNEFNVPAAGKKFVAIQIVVDNRGKDDWELSHSNFVLKDSEGNVYDFNNNVIQFHGVIEPTLKSGPVDSGDLVKGWITYQIGNTVNVRSLKLRYEDSLSSEQLIKSGWIPLSVVLK